MGRSNALKLLCKEVINTKFMSKLEQRIDDGLILVRDPDQVCRDLGRKEAMTSLVMMYNPLWLRVALEVCFGESVPITSQNEVLSLKFFVQTRLLDCPDIRKKYRHATVPHMYKPGFEKEMCKHILKKFFTIVIFLDKAKINKLLRHDPCLFVSNVKLNHQKVC